MSLIDLASLVLAPTATKEGKVYSAIPDTGDGDMTFSRGSAATRVNSAGLIEKERANLLLQSNTFDTTWSNSGSTETSGQSGYDGSNDAWLLTKIAGSGRLQQAITKSGVCTLSVYAKAGTLDWIWIRAIDGVDNPNVFFDLQNGVKGITGGTNYIDSSIEQVGATGWYRLKLVFSQGITEIRIYPADDDGDVSGTSGNILIQDAMLNEGLVAQPYISTTTTAVYEGITDDVPRVDYSGGGCPSLKLEPQRSNLLPHSEYFGAWTLARTTLTNNDTTSPEGVNNATKVTQSASDTNGGAVYYTIALTSTEYSYSVFAKAGTASFINLAENASVASTQRTWFNLSTGAIGTTSSEHTATIKDYGNGWYRCSITFTARASGSYAVLNYLSNADNSTTAVLSSTAYLYGAMFEVGSYSTSLIPTYGTSTTRVQDSCSKTGISELIGQSEGTMFAEIDSSQFLTGSYIGISDGGTTNRQIFGWEANSGDSGTLRLYGFWNGFTYSSFSRGEKIKIALAYKTNDFALYVNGTQAGTNTSASTSGTLSQFAFNSGATSQKYQGNVYQAILFPTRLTNDQLQELTK